MGRRLLGAALLLCLPAVLHAFATEERGDAFGRSACPAFLIFDNAAYLADMTFELPCRCKPKEVSSVVWYFQKNAGSHKTTVLTDLAGAVGADSSHVRAGSALLKRFSIRVFSLIVFRAQATDSGHYICGTQQGDFFYGYDVDVQPTEHLAVTFVDTGQHVQEDYRGKLFSLFTTFWDWTGCDRCGVRGEQRRIGLCYVQSPGCTPGTARPCPASLLRLQGRPRPPLRRPVRRRRPEVAIRSCLSPCLEKEGPEEGVQAIANVISKLGEKPWEPRVPTQFHAQPVGTDLVVACPGARPEHAVAWDRESIRLYRSRYLLGVNASMRVFIDHGNHLHVRRLRASDRGTYFCWREGEKVAGFRLSVTYPPRRRRTLYDPETLYAVKVIGASYILISIIFVLINVYRCCWWGFRGLART